MKSRREASTRELAMNYLARREHSYFELKQKLLAKARELADVESVLQRLMDQGLQSDWRFTESYVGRRSQSGFGPRRITVELQQKGVDRDMISRALAALDIDWAAQVYQLCQSRFSRDPIEDPKQVARRYRFLLGRGFTPEQIKNGLNDEVHDFE